MKKLVILILTLGLITTANAGSLSLDNPSGGTVNIIGSGYTTAEASTSFILYEASLSVSSITMVYPGDGSGFPPVPLTTAEFYEDLFPGSTVYQINIQDTDPFDDIPNGLLVTSSTTGVGTVYLLNGTTGATIDSITIVPEPATMALLALGGLMLRRKK